MCRRLRPSTERHDSSTLQLQRRYLCPNSLRELQRAPSGAKRLKVGSPSKAFHLPHHLSAQGASAPPSQPSRARVYEKPRSSGHRVPRRAEPPPPFFPVRTISRFHRTPL